ncbi:MAG: hypothetical protein V4584_15765 [Verrucomicrobiota bacterium]
MPGIRCFRIHPELLEIDLRTTGFRDFLDQPFPERGAVRINDGSSDHDRRNEKENQSRRYLDNAGSAVVLDLLLVRLGGASFPFAHPDGLGAIGSCDQLSILGAFRWSSLQPIHHLVDGIFFWLAWGA